MENVNAKEILEIAIQNEKNGIEFYSKLAQHTKDDVVKKTLMDFVRQENDHLITFQGMINDLLEEKKDLNYYDDPEELLYLKAIANASVFVDVYNTEHIKELLSDVLAALHYAVGAEIKSIEFYKQLMRVMAPGTGKDTVKELIEQEKGHVKDLYKMINEHKG